MGYRGKDWDAPSRTTTLLLYTDPDGGTGACTGTLLNDADPATYIPSPATAHHCIAEQTRAGSLEAYWFRRSRECDSGKRDYQAVSGGADLLYAAKSADTSFLRLRQPPPAGALFSGWSGTLPPLGTAVTPIHHPRGARQAIAVGHLTDYVNCTDVDYCADRADADTIHYLRATCSRGFTDSGSSGSGLFLDTEQLVGTLVGGLSDCEKHQEPDDFGRFDLAYREALYKWLATGAAGAQVKAPPGTL